MRTRLLKRLRKEAFKKYKLRCIGMYRRKYEIFDVYKTLGSGLEVTIWHAIDFDTAKWYLKEERIKYILRTVKQIRDERIASVRNEELNVNQI